MICYMLAGTSWNPDAFFAAGLPSSRQRMVTIMALVVFCPGANVVFDTPFIRQFS